MFLAVMVRLWRGLLRLCLALAFLVGATAQLVPCGLPLSDMNVRAETPGGCAASQAPCTGHLPNCVDRLGCLTFSALPASPTSAAVRFAWTLLDYDIPTAVLSGISIEPELSPPIPAT